MQGITNDHDHPDTDDLVERALRGVDDVAVLVFDADMRFRAVHGGATARHGFDPDALVGRRAPDVLPTPSWEVVGPLYSAALAGRTVVAETPAADGTVYETVFAPVLADGRVVGGTAVSREVTAVREARAAQDAQRRAEAVAAARARFETAFAGAPVGMALLASSGRIVQANTALARLVGRDVGALQALPAAVDLVAPADRPALRRAWQAARDGAGDAQEVGAEILAAGTGPVPVRISMAVLPGGAGEPDVVLHVVDVSALDRAQRELAATRALFEVAFHAAPVGKLITRLRPDGGTEVLQCNAAMGALVGRDVADVVGRSVHVLLHPGELRARRELLDELVAGRPASAELRFLHAEGHDVWTAIEAHVVPGTGGEPLAVLQVVDRTEAREAERRLRRATDTDDLTGTLSRVAVQATLAHELEAAAAADRPTALLRLDIDGFKHVNEVLGPEAGDALLHDLARVLREALRPADVLGRLGGDEFAVLLPGTDLDAAAAVGGRLVDAVRLHGHVVGDQARAEVTASCGVAVAPGSPTPAGELLQQAEMALYDAKKAGRDRVATVTPGGGVVAKHARSQHWLGRLRRALAEDRLVLHAQPLVPLGRPEEAPPRRELLLRLVGEDGALVPPSEFLGHAERHGLVLDLDLWVLRRAVRRLHDAAVAGRPERLSVNLSARSAQDPRVVGEVERLLAAMPLPAGSLTVEITETAAIDDLDAAGALTRRLHELGVRVALDDFGAGHACLAALKHLALDELKVDGSLVAGLSTSPTDQLVVRAVVGIADELGLDVVAEHVGDAPTVELLRALGVDFGQGFLLGRPVPLAAG